MSTPNGPAGGTQAGELAFYGGRRGAARTEAWLPS
jgi:hypothetical protein